MGVDLISKTNKLLVLNPYLHEVLNVSSGKLPEYHKNSGAPRKQLENYVNW